MRSGSRKECISDSEKRMRNLSIQENIKQIKENIAAAKQKSPNPEAEVTLVAVTKMHEGSELTELYQAGQEIFGENRVQELLEKYDSLPEDIHWHLIGHLQSNKVKYIIDKVELVHSLDSIELAEEISKQMLKHGKAMPCLVQVNVAHEPQKYGIDPLETESFIRRAAELSGIKIVGLMHIAPDYADKEQTRPLFRQMYQLFAELKEKNIPQTEMKYLSMGMSGDYQIAVEEGSNMLRIGHAVFAV